MIVSLIFGIAGIALSVIAGVLSAITFPIPTAMIEAIEFWVAKIHYLDFLIPVDTLMTAIGVYITFLTYWYSVKIILWLYHLIRHGAKAETPKLNSEQELTWLAAVGKRTR